MKKGLLLFLLLGTLAAQAQNINVFGLQSGVWDADTVFVTGDVTVRDSLSILPGTTVLFEGFYSITAENGASLKAVGTENDSILFTVADTTGFHLYNFGRGGWNGIRLEQAGPSKFDYCRFQYGKAALDKDQDGGALRIFDSYEVEISNSTLFCNFSREHGGALNAERSQVVLHDCAVTDNRTYSFVDTIYYMYGGGLRFFECKVEIKDVDFLRNVGTQSIGGALCIDSCAANIDRCRFEHNIGINGGGLYMIRSYETSKISNSLFANNTSVHFAGGLAIKDSSPEISNLTVVNNHSIGVNCGGMFFYQLSSPLVRNCIVYGNTNTDQIGDPVQIWCWTYNMAAPRFLNCLIQYGLKNIVSGENVQVYENNLDTDPCFVDAANGDFRLGGNSPCINSGYTCFDDLDALDLDLSTRVKGGIIDMGAYEFSGAGIGEIAQNESFIRIIGNPITATSYAEIELESQSNLKIAVYSMDGKPMINKDLGTLPAGTQRIEIGGMFEGWAKGSYLMVVSNAERTLSAKIVL